MKIQKLLTFLFALLLVTGMTSCDKDDDKEPTKRDLLAASEWNGQSIYIYGSNETQLFIEALGFDIKKNRVRFDKNGKYAESYERVTVNGDWEFADNEQSILFDKGTDDEYSVRIIKLTDKELHIEQTLEEDGQTLPIELRYSR